jgi:hypothetical protein
MRASVTGSHSHCPAKRQLGPPRVAINSVPTQPRSGSLDRTIVRLTSRRHAVERPIGNAPVAPTRHVPCRHCTFVLGCPLLRQLAGGEDGNVAGGPNSTILTSKGHRGAEILQCSDLRRLGCAIVWVSLLALLWQNFERQRIPKSVFL